MIVDPLTKTVYWKTTREMDLTADAFTRECNDEWVRIR